MQPRPPKKTSLFLLLPRFDEDQARRPAGSDGSTLKTNCATRYRRWFCCGVANQLRSFEALRLRSFVALLWVTEGFHRIDVHGAAGGEITGYECRGAEQGDDNAKRHRVCRGDAEEQAAQEAG